MIHSFEPIYHFQFSSTKLIYKFESFLTIPVGFKILKKRGVKEKTATLWDSSEAQIDPETLATITVQGKV